MKESVLFGFILQIVHQSAVNGKGGLLLILFCREIVRFLRIGKESALRHYSRNLCFIQQKEVVFRGFDLAGIVRLQILLEGILQFLCEDFGLRVVLAIKDLCSTGGTLLKFVLMDADEDCFRMVLDDFEPLVHIRTFLAADLGSALPHG